MMKQIFFCFILLIALQMNAQKDEFHFVSGHTFLAASGGNFSGKYTALYQQFESWGMKSHSQYNSFIGIAGNGTLLTNRKGFWDSNICFEIMIPETFLKNDSQQIDLSGHHLMTSLFGKDVIPGYPFALVLAPGVEWGKYKIHYQLNDQKINYSHKIISPFVRAEFRYKISHLIIGSRASWRFDLNKSGWKTEFSNSPVLAETKFTGFSYQFFLGWNFSFKNRQLPAEEVSGDPEE